MATGPYPSYPPSYRTVDQTGGYVRTCLVVELLSNGSLDPAHLTYIQEQLEAAIAKLLPSVIEKSQVIVPSRFDRPLRDGLRIS